MQEERCENLSNEEGRGGNWEKGNMPHIRMLFFKDGKGVRRWKWGREGEKEREERQRKGNLLEIPHSPESLPSIFTARCSLTAKCVRAQGETHQIHSESVPSHSLNRSLFSISLHPETFTSPRMSRHWLEEKSISIFLPPSLNSHVHSCDIETLCLCMCVCVWQCEHALTWNTAYVLPNKQITSVHMHTFVLLSCLAQRQGACVFCILACIPQYTVKEGRSAATHTVRHGA